MSFNFPADPSLGQDYDTGTGLIYSWNGYGWIIKPTPLSIADGDKGDIIVSGGGLSWTIDTTVITPAARSVLDDATTAAMRTTLGAEPVISGGTTSQFWRGDKAWTAVPPDDWSTITNKPALEPAIAIGTVSQFWRGDKTWQAISTIGAAYLPLAGGQMTGILSPRASVGGIATGSGTYGIEVKGAGAGTDAAYIAFHRPSAFAVYFGLDTDNQMAYGGWSLGAARRILWDTNNFNPAAYAPVAGSASSFYAGGGFIAAQNFSSNTAAVVVGTTGAGNCYQRPNGVNSGAGEARLDNTGGYYISGLIWAVGSASNTTTNATNTYMNPAGNMHRSTSSAAFKTALEPLEAAFADKVLDLQTVFYRPSEDTVDRTDWSRYGFLAEDCYAVDPRFSCCEKVPAGTEPIPDAPEADPPSTKAVLSETEVPIHHDLNAIVAALLDVVRRQNERIAALEAAG